MASRSFGVKLFHKVATVYTEITDVVDLTPPTESRDTQDVTNHSSTGSSKEFIVTWHNPGTVTAQIHYDPADTQHAALRTAFTAGSVNDYKVTLPGASPGYAFTFAAYITEFAVGSMSVDGITELSVTLTITGPIGFSNS